MDDSAADRATDLARASEKQLRETLAAPSLERRALCEILRNPVLTGDMIRLIEQRGRAQITPEIRAALARHPRTPVAIALKIVPSLGWRDRVEEGRGEGKQGESLSPVREPTGQPVGRAHVESARRRVIS